MPSLRDVSSFSPMVVIDAASAKVQVGVFDGLAPARWASRSEEAGVAIFQCLEELAVSPTDVGCWVYCVGPGSVLGVRTAAMALRTWRILKPAPVFGYESLAIIAFALDRPESAVISDARRETWHHFTPATGLRRVATADLGGGLIMPDGFRHWSMLPHHVTRVPYHLETLLPRVWNVPLLHASESPDAFLHEEPRYLTWAPQIHRAPAS